MLNSPNASCTPPSPGDSPARERFRNSLRPTDAADIERLVTLSCVFNAEEIAMARSLVEETLGAAGGCYRFLMADGVSGIEGYTCYGPIPGTDRRYELYWIVTDAASRGQGLARALLEVTEQKVRAEGGTHLFAETSTRDDYSPAHRLYSAQGYTRHCTVPDYHADGDALAIFGKRL